MNTQWIISHALVGAALLAAGWAYGDSSTTPLVGHTADPLVVKFEFAKADLKSDDASESRYATFAQELNNYPFAKLEIDGHTDSIGPNAVNDKLSAERAEAVRRYFIEKYGVAPDRIVINAHGKRLPVASNDTRDGRRQNRVAVARVYRMEPTKTGPDSHNL